MATQRRILNDAYGAEFPTLANFSDGAVYFANVYCLGIDYFELLDNAEQNAIWSEDWSSLASSYQCSTYNVELMRVKLINFLNNIKLKFRRHKSV